MGLSLQWWPSSSESSKSLLHVFPDEVELLPSAALWRVGPSQKGQALHQVAARGVRCLCRLAFLLHCFQSLGPRRCRDALGAAHGLLRGGKGPALFRVRAGDRCVLQAWDGCALEVHGVPCVMSSIELTGTALSGSSDNDEDFDQFEAAPSTAALSCGKAEKASEASEASYDEFSSPAVKCDKEKKSTWIKAM